MESMEMEATRCASVGFARALSLIELIWKNKKKNRMSVDLFTVYSTRTLSVICDTWKVLSVHFCSLSFVVMARIGRQALESCGATYYSVCGRRRIIKRPLSVMTSSRTSYLLSVIALRAQIKLI
jgi:hypothetical protein